MCRVPRYSEVCIVSLHFSISTEGTNPDETLDYPVTKLEDDFFKESFGNEFDLFRSYFKAIK